MRSPRYAGWRIEPPAVHSVNRTSTTSTGSTNTRLRRHLAGRTDSTRVAAARAWRASAIQLGLREAGADPARVVQLRAVVARSSRRATSRSARCARLRSRHPSADDELLLQLALPLHPRTRAATGFVRRVEPLRDHAFEPELLADRDRRGAVADLVRRRLPRRARELEARAGTGAVRCTAAPSSSDRRARADRRSRNRRELRRRAGGSSRSLSTCMRRCMSWKLGPRRRRTTTSSPSSTTSVRPERLAERAQLGIAARDVVTAAVGEPDASAVDVAEARACRPTSSPTPNRRRSAAVVVERREHRPQIGRHRRALGIRRRIHAVDHPVAPVGLEQRVPTAAPARRGT